MKLMVYSPTKIIFGSGTLELLGQEVRRYGSRALLLTSRSFARRYGYLDFLIGNLRNSGVNVYVFEGVEPNPPFEQCESITSKFKDKGIDVVIGFGGGSVIDAAKAVATALSTDKDLRSLSYPNVIDFDVLPIIAIPTTCGTGSEVTKYAILTDKQRGKKVPLVGPSIIPKTAIVDPKVLRHLPQNLLIWTSLDAFTHSLEGYIAKTSNPITDAIALKSMELIVKNIGRASEKSMDVLEKLHLAATMGGLVINVTGTTLIHAIGYHLTTHYGIHHGLANALILPYVLELNITEIPNDKALEILSLFNSSSIEELFRNICKFLVGLGVPESLSKVGIREDAIDHIIEDTLGYKRNLEVNPAKVDREVLRKVLEKAIRGCYY